MEWYQVVGVCLVIQMELLLLERTNVQVGFDWLNVSLLCSDWLIFAGCGSQLRDGQALVALDKQYHIWCFKCTACDALLHGGRLLIG